MADKGEAKLAPTSVRKIRSAAIVTGAELARVVSGLNEILG